jgi:hypothetical protein
LLVLVLAAGCSRSKQTAPPDQGPPPAPITDTLSVALFSAEMADALAGVNVGQRHATQVVRLALTAGASGPADLRARCNAVADHVGRPEVARILYAVCAGASLDAFAPFGAELRTDIVQHAIALALPDSSRGEFRRDLQLRVVRDLGLPNVVLAENAALPRVLARVFRDSAVEPADVERMLNADPDDQPGKLFDLVAPALDELVRSTEDGVSARNPAAVAATMCRLRAVIALGDHVTTSGSATAFGLFGSIWRGVKAIGKTALSTAGSLVTGGGLTGVISAARNVVRTISSVVGGVKSLVGGGSNNPRIVIPWPNGEAATQRMLGAMQRLMRQTKNEILARLDDQNTKLVRISQQLSELYATIEQRFRELKALLENINRNLTERLRELSIRLDELEENVRRFVADNLAELAGEIEQRFTQVLFQAMSDALVRIQAKIAGLRADRDPLSFQRTVAELSALIIGSAQSVLLFAHAPSDTEHNLGRHTKSLLPFYTVVPIEVLSSAIGIGNTILVTLGARPIALSNPMALTLPTIELAQALATSTFFTTRAQRSALVGELMQAMEAARTNLAAMFSSGLQLTTARLDDVLASASREWAEQVVRVPYRPKINTTDRVLLDRWVVDEMIDSAGYVRFALEVGTASFASGRARVTYFVNGEGPYVMRSHDPLKKLAQLGLLRIDAATSGSFPVVWDVGTVLPSLRTYTGSFATLQVTAAGSELEVRLNATGVTPIQLLERAQTALALFERDFADIIRNRLNDADLRGLRSMFSLQSATRLLLELARDTFVADTETRTRIVALLERPLIFSETLATLLGVDPAASLSWSLHVKRLLTSQVERMFRREVGLATLDDYVTAMRPAVVDLREDAVTLARAIEASATVIDYGLQTLRAWVEAGGASAAAVGGEREGRRVAVR